MKNAEPDSNKLSEKTEKFMNNLRKLRASWDTIEPTKREAFAREIRQMRDDLKNRHKQV